MLILILFSSLIFLIAWLGMFLSRQHIIIILIVFEIMLLSINVNFFCFSIFYDDFLGQLFGFFVLTIAAAESALGLAILVVYYRLRGGIAVSLLTLLKS